MNHSHQDAYFLEVGEKGRERMHLLNRLYNPSTQQFLRISGLAPGMRVLEAGCGVGVMSSWLAEAVGPTGAVVAIDQSPEQLTIARQFAATRSLAHLEFHQVSTYDVARLRGEFDFVFGRWVLLHSTDPLAALRALYGKLRPGGILAFEDCVTNTALCYPQTPAFARFIQGWLDVSRVKNIDPHIGDRLPRLFQEIGCQVSHLRHFQPLLTSHEDKRLPSMSLAESYQVHVETGAMTDAEIAETIQELSRLAGEHNVMAFVRNVQVSGRTAIR